MTQQTDNKIETRPYKFVVQAICQQVDAKGHVLGEANIAREDGTPFVLYGCDALAEFAGNFPGMLTQAGTSGPG